VVCARERQHRSAGQRAKAPRGARWVGVAVGNHSGGLPGYAYLSIEFIDFVASWASLLSGATDLLAACAIADLVTAVTAFPAVSAAFLGPVLGSRGVQMTSEASSSLSVEDRRQIAGGLFSIDDVLEATFRDQFERLDDDVVDGRCSFLHSLPEHMYPRPRGWAR
jgi:hypothetical protein